MRRPLDPLRPLHSFAAMFPIVVALAGGCHPPSEPGSCARESESACTEYTAREAAAAKRMCVNQTWTERGSCPKSGVIGDCVHEGGAVVDHIYAGAPNQFTAATAQKLCEAKGGVWRS